jgi:colicin import membrane protein
MGGSLREFGPYIVVAALLHIGLVAFLVVSLERSIPVIEIDTDTEAIEATVVDEALVEAELERIRADDRRRQQEVVDAQAAVEAARQQRLREEQQARELQAQQQRDAAAAATRAEQARQRRAAEEQAERERLAELARQRQTEEARLAELERQRQAAAERQRREQQAREQAERETREAAARQRQEQTVLNQWLRDIQQKVQRYWIQPDDWPPGTSCTVRVSMIPGGEVVQARLLNSCGDPVRDRSVELAALRASPMPMPSDPALFQRQIDLVFRPIN